MTLEEFNQDLEDAEKKYLKEFGDYTDFIYNMVCERDLYDEGLTRHLSQRAINYAISVGSLWDWRSKFIVECLKHSKKYNTPLAKALFKKKPP